MTLLVLAALSFVALHVLVSGTALRARIVERIGEGPFRGVFSLATLLAIVGMVQGYRRAPLVPLWDPLPGGAVIALAVMLVAFLLVGIGFTTPNPTAVGGEDVLARDDPARGILRVTRHPFLWGVSLWAFAHLLVNGDLASLVLFGTFLFVALLGPSLIDAKRQRALGPAWERFAAVTSNVPFGAIARGRTTLRVAEVGWWRIAAGVLLFAVFLAAHRWLFGVSPFPG